MLKNIKAPSLNTALKASTVAGLAAAVLATGIPSKSRVPMPKP